MVSTHGELIHTEIHAPYTVRFYAEIEYDNPADHFASGDDALDCEVCEKIERGDYAWFCAHVVAEIEGIELGHAYLGACCYDSVQQFVDESDYFTAMVDEAIEAAEAMRERIVAA